MSLAQFFLSLTATVCTSQSICFTVESTMLARVPGAVDVCLPLAVLLRVGRVNAPPVDWVGRVETRPGVLLRCSVWDAATAAASSQTMVVPRVRLHIGPSAAPTSVGRFTGQRQGQFTTPSLLHWLYISGSALVAQKEVCSERCQGRYYWRRALTAPERIGNWWVHIIQWKHEQCIDHCLQHVIAW